MNLLPGLMRSFEIRSTSANEATQNSEISWRVISGSNEFSGRQYGCSAYCQFHLVGMMGPKSAIYRRPEKAPSQFRASRVPGEHRPEQGIFDHRQNHDLVHPGRASKGRDRRFIVLEIFVDGRRAGRPDASDASFALFYRRRGIECVEIGI